MLINKLNFGLALKLHAVIAICIDSQFSIIAKLPCQKLYNMIYLKINFLLYFLPIIDYFCEVLHFILIWINLIRFILKCFFLFGSQIFHYMQTKFVLNKKE